MRSRAVREGSVGLLVLLGLGVLTGIFFWIRGSSLGNQAYTLKVELADTLGLDAGSPVRFRGVKVGRVTAVEATTGGAIVTAEIASPNLLIPRETVVEASQSGFIGQVTLDFKAPESVPEGALAAELSPFDPDCDPSVILCQGDQLQGSIGLSFDQLIRATTSLATELGGADLQATLKNLSTAAVGVNQLSKRSQVTLRDVSKAANSLNQLSGNADQQLRRFGVAATAITRAANQVGQVGDQFSTTANAVTQAAGQVGQVGTQFSTTAQQLTTTTDQVAQRLTTTTDQINELIQTNRGTLVVTLDNLQATSQDLRTVVQDLGPVIGRLQQSELLDNLETIAANGAVASESLKNVAATANNPLTLVSIAQTLDAARATFQNAQKITTNLDQITGNPEFLENLIRLVNGLSKLVSSSQELEQQLLVGQQPDPVPTPTRVEEQEQ